MKKIITCVFMLILFFSAFGQKKEQDIIDSMITRLSHANEDTLKVKLLADIAFQLSENNPDKGIEYGQQAMDLAVKLNWKTGIVMAYNELGICHDIRGDYAKALEYYNKGLIMAKDIKSKKQVIRIMGNMGVVYEEEGLYDKAFENDSIAYKYCEENKNKHSMAINLNNLSEVSQHKGDYAKALAYDSSALQLYRELGDSVNVYKGYIGFGKIYYYESNYAKALEYYLKALKIAESRGDKATMIRSVQGMGVIYEREQDYTNALKYNLEGLKYSQDAGYKNGVGVFLGNVGNTYYFMKDFPKAMEYLFKALKWNEDMGDRTDVAVNMDNIGLIFNEQKDSDFIKEGLSPSLRFSKSLEYGFGSLKIYSDLKEKAGWARAEGNIGRLYYSIALDTLDRALPDSLRNKTTMLHKADVYMGISNDINKEIGNEEGLQKGYIDLSAIQERIGKYQDALTNYRNGVALKDSVFSLDSKKKIANLEAKRETELKQKEIEIQKLQLNREQNERYGLFGGLGLMGVIAVVFYRNFRRKKRDNIIITKEKERSEELLLNILPAETAEELKSTGGAKAKSYDMVTVLFTDFKNFTQASEKLNAEQLVEEIHHCYSEFDRIITKYGIEKIKTIGDSYMCAGGLPVQNATNPVDAVNAALEIQKFMHDLKLSKEKEGLNYFEIRIGIHTGPVVAGIVGIKKFAYDIWGDTVNIASRMESSGEAGRVNISESTFQLVKDKFLCEHRGKIDAKNKGVIDMYFVLQPVTN